MSDDTTGHLSGTPLVRGFEATKIRSAELFAEMNGDHATPGGRATARDELVHLHLPLVEHCARRFRNRGEHQDRAHRIHDVAADPPSV